MDSVSIFQNWISPDADKSSLPSLVDPKVRDGIYKLFPNSLKPEHRMLIQELLCEEVIYRRDLWEGNRSDDEYFENIYLCVLLLSRLGVVQDVFHIWEVKHINMDVGSVVDVYYFVGAGVESTRSFLQQESCEKSKLILQYIEGCDISDDDYQEWVIGQLEYHEISLF